MEKYLLEISDFKLRRIICKFRCSNHCLLIEKGRHTKPKTPVEQRLCTKCNAMCVEDENHFLCECSFYNDIRKDFYYKRRSLGFYNEDFIDIMTSQNNFYLGKCLIKMFNRRKE